MMKKKQKREKNFWNIIFDYVMVIPLYLFHVTIIICWKCSSELDQTECCSIFWAFTPVYRPQNFPEYSTSNKILQLSRQMNHLMRENKKPSSQLMLVSNIDLVTRVVS